MKKHFRFISVLVLLFITMFLISSTSLKKQPATESSSSLNRAAPGDTVWVLLNRIKPDKRQQFEKFIHEIFWPKAVMLPLAEQQAFFHTRVLHPVKMNEDSSDTYIFIMDPVIHEVSYSFRYYLNKMYGEAQAKEFHQMLSECYLNSRIEQTEYVVIQSAH